MADIPQTSRGLGRMLVVVAALMSFGTIGFSQDSSTDRPGASERWRMMKRRAIEQQSVREDEWVRRRTQSRSSSSPFPDDADVPRVKEIRGASLRDTDPDRVFQDLSLAPPSPDFPEIELPSPSIPIRAPELAFQPDPPRRADENAPYPRVLEAESRLRASLSLAEISPRYEIDEDRDLREFARASAADSSINLDETQLKTFPRHFEDQLAIWDASDLSYYPLYFEDPALERYGHTLGPCLQPFASVGRWTGQLLLLPYHMTVDPICTPVTGMGWYRPGECTPQLKYRFGWNLTAAAVEAGAVAGMVYFIP